MTLKKLHTAFIYYRQFIPLKFNFILLLVLFYFINKVILTSLQNSESSFAPILRIGAKVTLLSIALIVVISFLSTLATWLYFVVNKRKAGHQIEIEIQKEATETQKIVLKTSLHKTYRPLLGFVKARYMYDKTKWTDKLLLSGNVVKKIFSLNKGIQGINTFHLPDIKEYHFNKGILFFEDMFQFFSFATTVPLNQTIYHLPKNLNNTTDTINPKNTQEQTVRIDQLRKVEGEYLNYKKFEDNDDVRRIVWKIFAKNKELVVRSAERLDPFASHLNFYASFSNHLFSNVLNTDMQAVLLNFYKNVVWTIYDELSKKEFAIKYISDQTINTPNSTTVTKEKYTIGLSEWQYKATIQEYFNSNKGSVLCFSSCINTTDLQNIIDTCDTQTHLFFIKSSSQFKNNILLHWLEKLFLLPNNDELKKIKHQWTFSLAKRIVVRNEKEIERILQSSDIPFEIIS
jgi:hypothetical protein